MIKELGKVYQNAEVAVILLDEDDGFTLYLSAKSTTKNPILVDMHLEYGDHLYVTPSRYACVHIRNIIRQFGLGRINKLSNRDKYFEIRDENGIRSLFCKFVVDREGKGIYIDQWAAQNMTLLWDQAMSGYSITYVFSTQKRLKVYSTSKDCMASQWWSRDQGIIRYEVDIPKLPEQVEKSLNKIVNAEILIEG